MHSADDWDDLLLPEIDRQQAAGKRVAFRADAAFAKPEIYDASWPTTWATCGADWSCRRGSSAGRSPVSSSGW